MPTYEYIVSGMVQGVGYRYYATRVAAQLSVKGWVRNMPTGQVQVVASASEEVLKRFEQALEEGPRMSRVTSVQRAPAMDENFDGFGVRY